MKKIIIMSLCALMGLTMLAACKHDDNGNKKKREGLTIEGPQQKKGSSGKTLELLIVANKDVYCGATKTLIDSLFAHPQIGLPSPEPIFDIVNIPISSFENTEMFHVHRNVVKCDINPNNLNKVYKQIDVWAAPQVVFDIAAKDRQSLDSMLAKYQPIILKELYEAEYRRIYKAFRLTEGIKLNDYLQKRLGFRLTFSEDFAIAKDDDDFIWVRKETKDFGLGILIKTMPYSTQKQFSKAYILDNIDTIMKHNVPGPTQGSYMATERRDFIVSDTVKIDGQYAVETRCRWRCVNDFMGGPMVNYTILSPDNKQVITLTAYVYCPRFNKRDYLMQVDGICHSLKFDKK